MNLATFLVQGVLQMVLKKSSTVILEASRSALVGTI